MKVFVTQEMTRKYPYTDGTNCPLFHALQEQTNLRFNKVGAFHIFLNEKPVAIIDRDSWSGTICHELEFGMIPSPHKVHIKLV